MIEQCRRIHTDRGGARPCLAAALAQDPRRRFTLADTAFTVRWLEDSGGKPTPPGCVYVSFAGHDGREGEGDWRRRSARRRAEEPCPVSLLDLTRRLLRDGRLDVVGGGWQGPTDTARRIMEYY